MTKSRSRYLAWCMLLACTFSLARQISAQTASNPSPKQSSAAQANTDTGSLNLQVAVPLVVEDVVVLDEQDHPVHGLTASDFTVTEGGKPVVVRNFAENVAAPVPAVPVKPLDLGPNTFTNLPRTDLGPSLNILLLDALNTPMQDQLRVRQQMLSYLKELPPNTRIAVFGLATHLYLLQGFTSDPAVLRAALDHKRSRTISQILDDPVSGGPGTAMADTLNGAPLTGAVLASVQEFEAEQETANLELRMTHTLLAMNQLARYLSALPGRKNLIWFSGSFPLNTLPDGDLPNPFVAVVNFEDDVRQTAEMFARGRVAVYPVDARGLLTNPAWSVSNVQQLKPNSRGIINSSSIAASNNKANHQFFTQTNAEYATMDLIAKETGGKAFHMTNGLKQAVEKAMDFGGNYYTLSYTPTNQNWDGKYRKIKITIKTDDTDQPDLKLYFRPGYLADNPAAPAPKGEKVLPFNPMQTAMLRGGPDATQVLFDTRLVPAEKPSDELSPGADPDARGMKPPYLNYTVRVLVDVASLEMKVDAEGAGVHHGAAALAVVVYDGEGAPVNSASKQVAIDIPADRYAEALKLGAGTQLKIDVPVKGEYFLRIGIQDLIGNRVGALEVPISALKSFEQLQVDADRNATHGPGK